MKQVFPKREKVPFFKKNVRCPPDAASQAAGRAEGPTNEQLTQDRQASLGEAGKQAMQGKPDKQDMQGKPGEQGMQGKPGEPIRANKCPFRTIQQWSHGQGELYHPTTVTQEERKR